MWGAAVLVGFSALVFLVARDVAPAAWHPGWSLGTAIALMMLGIGAGVLVAELANSSFDAADEVWADYVFERFFAAILPVMPATAAAAVLAWRALLGWMPGEDHGFLESPGCGVLGFVLAVLIALVAAAGIA
jgi:hypothetical protein